MNLGKAIADLRKAKGLKQNEFADSLGISQPLISRYELNKDIPNEKNLRRIAKALGISLPLLYFQSMEDSDIPESKKLQYDLLLPTIKQLIHQLCT